MFTVWSYVYRLEDFQFQRSQGTMRTLYREADHFSSVSCKVNRRDALDLKYRDAKCKCANSTQYTLHSWGGVPIFCTHISVAKMNSCICIPWHLGKTEDLFPQLVEDPFEESSCIGEASSLQWPVPFSDYGAGVFSSAVLNEACGCIPVYCLMTNSVAIMGYRQFPTHLEHLLHVRRNSAHVPMQMCRLHQIRTCTTCDSRVWECKKSLLNPSQWPI